MDGGRGLQHPRCASHCSNSGPSDLFSTSRLSRPPLRLASPRLVSAFQILSKGFSRGGRKFSPIQASKGWAAQPTSSLSFQLLLDFEWKFLLLFLPKSKLKVSKQKNFISLIVYKESSDPHPEFRIFNRNRFQRNLKKKNILFNKFQIPSNFQPQSSSIDRLESPCEKRRLKLEGLDRCELEYACTGCSVTRFHSTPDYPQAAIIYRVVHCRAEITETQIGRCDCDGRRRGPRAATPPPLRFCNQ